MVHGVQLVVRVEAEFKHPMGFKFEGGYPLNRFFREAFGEENGFDIGGESIFVFALEKFLGQI